LLAEKSGLKKSKIQLSLKKLGTWLKQKMERVPFAFFLEMAPSSSPDNVALRAAWMFYGRWKSFRTC